MKALGKFLLKLLKMVGPLRNQKRRERKLTFFSQ